MNSVAPSTRRRRKTKLPMPGLAFWLCSTIGIILGMQFEVCPEWVAFGMAVGLALDIALKTQH